MNEKQWQQAESQLPQNAVITRNYRGFEDGSLRLVVRLESGQETRYFVHFEGEDVRLEHRP